MLYFYYLETTFLVCITPISQYPQYNNSLNSKYPNITNTLISQIYLLHRSLILNYLLKWDKCYDMVELVGFEFALPDCFWSTKTLNFVPATVEVGVIDSEVTVELSDVIFQPYLWISEDHEKLIMNHTSIGDFLCSLMQDEGLFVLQRNQKTWLY